jgi:hypothetical protein
MQLQSYSNHRWQHFHSLRLNPTVSSSTRWLFSSPACPKQRLRFHLFLCDKHRSAIPSCSSSAHKSKIRPLPNSHYITTKSLTSPLFSSNSYRMEMSAPERLFASPPPPLQLPSGAGGTMNPVESLISIRLNTDRYSIPCICGGMVTEPVEVFY